jgi:hypothetical protein
MSGIQLGSGQITVFAVITKLVSPCCHIYSFENIRVIAFPVGSHESGKPDGGSVNTCDNECQENSS